MRKTYFSCGPRERASQAEQEDGHDPLQDLVTFVDEDDPLTEEERDEIGELGSEDDIAVVDALINEMEAQAPTRAALLMHRVAESLRALRNLRSRHPQAWPKDRVSNEHWRALADEALGTLGDAARRELDEQRLIETMPKGEQESFQKLCDSRRGISVFHKSFERERDAWEKAYWRRALDESFGKRPWTGPAGGLSTK